jgi:hypothetical protein
LKCSIAQETQDAINKQKETSKQIDRYTMINQIETPAQALQLCHFF